VSILQRLLDTFLFVLGVILFGAGIAGIVRRRIQIGGKVGPYTTYTGVKAVAFSLFFIGLSLLTIGDLLWSILAGIWRLMVP